MDIQRQIELYERQLRSLGLTPQVLQQLREIERLSRLHSIGSVAAAVEQMGLAQDALSAQRALGGAVVGWSLPESFQRLSEIGRLVSESPAARAVEQAREAIAAVGSPFIDVSKLVGDNAWTNAIARFTSLNAALHDANLVGRFDVGSSGEPEFDDDETYAEAAEALIEVSPGEARAVLERVHSEPIRLLDRAIRDPRVMRGVSPRDFEGLCAALLERLGFEEVKLTPASKDGGPDVLALKRVEGLPIVFAFECKQFSQHRAVGIEIARALLGTVHHAETQASIGILLTTSRFTKDVREFFVSEPRIRGRDYEGLVEWLQEAKRR